MPFTFSHPYTIAPEYAKPVAYFCMEYAIHQPLKVYAGGLGFLSGSHMRSAYALKQNMVGVGILWKYGYYDQVRKNDQTMDVLFQEKVYQFLQPTGIKFTIPINGAAVWVTAWYLAPEVFETAPLFLLSTDLPENDYLSRTITHHLYDSNPETGIAAAILLGIGGAQLFTHLSFTPQTYHLNESAGLPLAFYLYSTCHSLKEVRKQLVYTNHTAEASGNRKTSVSLLEKMGFFSGVALSEVLTFAGIQNDQLDYTLTALRLAGIANAVSALHLQTLQGLWGACPGICSLIAITNGQNFTYWGDTAMYHALNAENDAALRARKLACKEVLFDYVADQNGNVLNKNIATLVFAKRFAGYKRPDLLLTNMARFEKLIGNKAMPVQIIWSGKPYPVDYAGIGIFNKLVHVCRQYPNCSILTGYELKLSHLLKAGADIWLNTPRLTHEACGTSGMSAAMNGAVNLTIADGWVPEFARDRFNCFVIPAAGQQLPTDRQDEQEATSLYNLLEEVVLPMYYQAPNQWVQVVKNSMLGIIPHFDSNRMAADYYRQLYLYTPDI